MPPTIRIEILCIIIILISPIIIGASAAVQVEDDAFPQQSGSAWVIDHTCVSLGAIPQEQISAAIQNVRIHYAHTSHGGQITTGLERLEGVNANLSQAQGYLTLPEQDGALCILDGNPPESYITPDLYWESEYGLNLTQNTLDDNPTITLSLWSWCTQLNYYSSEQVHDYLDAMASLEAANPDVTFVYMTGNAQADGEEGFTRYQNNEIIREYCRTNGKWLFDFADLDAWHNGVRHTYQFTSGNTTYTVPLEHPDFNGDEAAHTTYTSCEQKGRAFWWLVARVAGWSGGASTMDPLLLGLGIVSVIGIVAVLFVGYRRMRS